MLKKFVFKKISTIEIPKSSKLHRYAYMYCWGSIYDQVIHLACKYVEVFLIFASSRTMPGHLREFDGLKQHSRHHLVFKIWRNNNTEATLRVFLSLIVNFVSISLHRRGGRSARD